MIESSKSQRRNFHRVRFPIAEQPHWIIGDTSFAVVDLAETSCRLDPRGHETMNFAESMCGMLRFSDGDQIWVEGRTVRADPDGIAVQFTKGIALRKMVELQRSLVQKYPTRRESETQERPR